MLGIYGKTYAGISKTLVLSLGSPPLYGLCRCRLPQKIWFSAVLVINWASILTVVVINRISFLHLSLVLGMLFIRSCFFHR